MSTFISFSQPQSAATAEIEFDFLFRLHLANMLLMFALLIAYMVYLFKTKHVANDKKALWAVVLFMGNFVSMPIFWFLYGWRPLKNGKTGASGDGA
jgi:hypothetical protein